MQRGGFWIFVGFGFTALTLGLLPAVTASPPPTSGGNPTGGGGTVPPIDVQVMAAPASELVGYPINLTCTHDPEGPDPRYQWRQKCPPDDQKFGLEHEPSDDPADIEHCGQSVGSKTVGCEVTIAGYETTEAWTNITFRPPNEITFENPGEESAPPLSLASPSSSAVMCKFKVAEDGRIVGPCAVGYAQERITRYYNFVTGKKLFDEDGNWGVSTEWVPHPPPDSKFWYSDGMVYDRKTVTLRTEDTIDWWNSLPIGTEFNRVKQEIRVVYGTTCKTEGGGVALLKTFRITRRKASARTFTVEIDTDPPQPDGGPEN